MRALYLDANGRVGVIDDPRLDTTTERHKIDITPQRSEHPSDPLKALDADTAAGGTIIEMYLGWAGRNSLWLAGRVLGRRRRVWLYWPAEQALECVDAERLSSLWRHWVFITVSRTTGRMRSRIARLIRAGRAEFRVLEGAFRHVRLREFPRLIARRIGRALAGVPAIDPRLSAVRSRSDRLSELDAHIASAFAVPFPVRDHPPSASDPIAGCGAYLRTDFWARMESGGSYGHTCYVAKELAAVTGYFICFLAQRYRLLDDYGVHQVVLDPPSATASEDDIVNATSHYFRILKPAFEAVRPAYIYERLCLGNYSGALLSKSLGIPYIVEYNGSEISMRRSFDGTGYEYEAEYLKAEALAFRQATMISVISNEVRAGLVARGVSPDKILVNPNGADPVAYAPGTPEEKRSIRASVGLAADGPVVGFTGTFGGWHGVDVLAAALPKICARAPQVQFLFIGDGNYKHLVDTAVARYQLRDRVRMVGRVPQTEGARLLKACDIYVSPHNSHMVDSKFFGSPTKLFEYMAMGGAIVASDLEQIGESLSPGIAVADLLDPTYVVTDERAVLCVPGDIDEFVEAVVGLANQPDRGAALGRNARQAVLDHYSWAKHVARLWPWTQGERRQPSQVRRKADRRGADRPPQSDRPLHNEATSSTPAVGQAQVTTGDRYKDEVQRQWNNDPAGSHYVKDSDPHTLEWFLEAEAYRYGEYAPWMAETMEFNGHAGEDLLEIGGGMGTDLAQFARAGARVTDVDLSSGHLELAKENFRHRGLTGRFVHHDAETLPFDDASFDAVYSNGVLHHTPNTRSVVGEISRVLRPGGRAIVMMYAENSLHYWRNLVWAIGLKQHQLATCSMGEIMSRSVERSDNAAARPLVKVYTRSRLAAMFDGFEDIEICQRQMVAEEKPRWLTWVPLPLLGKAMGWNLIIKARKPRR